ncbi:MAG: hypothetical protein Q8N12_05780 [Thermodesulfovibrionales bacterium]|nr:hypothetical protein [Thermodesulfovibrionales bacterium]
MLDGSHYFECQCGGGLSILYGLFSIKRTMNFIPVYFSMIGNGGISVYG